MSALTELLYESWVSTPDPKKWPEHLREHPLKGHGEYAFQQGLHLGLLLAVEALYPETGPWP